METADPVEALSSKDIAQRAAGCRDLSMNGTVENLVQLSQIMGGDRSPGVRLSAAVAAADILSRCRVGSARDVLSDEQRDVFVAMFAKVDPALNAGVFPVLACLDRPRSFQLIAGGLRDPRRDVRLGAAVGLMRLCTSISVAGNKDFEEAVVALLADNRHQPDAVAQVARVCAAAGFVEATEFIRHLHLTGIHAEMTVEALGTLDGSKHPLGGVWHSDGRDAGETNPTPEAGPALMVFSDAGQFFHDGKRWTKVTKWAPVRRMFVRKSGEPEAVPTFQDAERTYYVGLGRVADALVGKDGINLRKATKASDAAIKAIEACASDSAADQRTLGILAVDAGNQEMAIKAFQAAIDGKKTPADCWLFLADLQWENGAKKAAKENYQAYQKKGKKKENPEGMERAKARA